MHTRDASGRQVSLLNDEHGYATPQRLAYRAASHAASSRPFLSASASSSYSAPELLRSDSYDSQMSNESPSPMTPTPAYSDYSRGGGAYADDVRSPYDDYWADGNGLPTPKRTGSFGDGVSSPYVDDDDAATSPSTVTGAADRSGKRYPCRYRDSHGCDKTFTTSGHASRHSKIHTAEKAVQCTFHGCPKKFTRADNMKQHLETHYKDKSRASSSRPSASGRRSSSSAKPSAGSGKKRDAAGPSSPHRNGGAWDMRELDLPLTNGSGGSAATSNGLYTLALVAAHQDGGGA